MKTTTTTVRIRLDQAIEVEHRNMNLSEFIRDKLDEEFGTNDFMEAKERELTEQLEKIKQIKKDNQISKKDLHGEEEKFLQGAKERVRKNPGELAENCRVYNMKFGKRITVIKFGELIES